ncbi:hypothetical protein Dimus_030068 [Dionaea muscipula]
MVTSSSFRGLGSKCRALMAAAKSSSAATSTYTASIKPRSSSKKSLSPPSPSPSSPPPPSPSPSSPPPASSSSPTRGGIFKTVTVSPQLGEFLGAHEASRNYAVKKVWEYIKARDLQDPANKKVIHTDEKLKTIFDGKDKVEFLEVARLLSQHFIKTEK